MPGEGAHPSTYPGRDYRTVKNKKLKDMEADIKAVVDSLVSLTNRNSFYRILTRIVSEELINFCYRVLEEAVKRCPYETGELRSSGAVNIYTGGTSNLAVSVDADSSGNYSLNKLMNSVRQPARTIEAEISFEKVEKGIDIALWAHEELLPWVDRPKSASQKGKWYARQVGTGPKYLEKPFKEEQFRIKGMMEKATRRAIQEYNKKYGTRVRRGRR